MFDVEFGRAPAVATTGVVPAEAAVWFVGDGCRARPDGATTECAARVTAG
jgi:hypothetical protein